MDKLFRRRRSNRRNSWRNIRKCSRCSGRRSVCSDTILIQAEDYSIQSGVLLEDTTDSGLGQNIGFIDVDDSLYYNIDIPTQGDYTIEFRLASRVNGANFDIYENNVLIGILSSNATGGYQDWETVVEQLHYLKGHKL